MRSNWSLRYQTLATAIYPKKNKVESSEDRISNAGWSRKQNMRIREGDVVAQTGAEGWLAILLELVDIGDSLGEGGLELVELLLDDIAVTAGSLALSLGSHGVDLAGSDITSKVVDIASAGDAGVAT